MQGIAEFSSYNKRDREVLIAPTLPLTDTHAHRRRAGMAARHCTPKTTAYERVMERCFRFGGCFIWQGMLSHGGYGQVVDGERLKMVHRVVYEHHNGPIPAGLDIDHVKARGCVSRACCEIAHLEAVTHRENVMRGVSPSAVHAAKTHCANGHPLEGANLGMYVGPRKRFRFCRTCMTAYKKRKYIESKGLKNKVAS